MFGSKKQPAKKTPAKPVRKTTTAKKQPTRKTTTRRGGDPMRGHTVVHHGLDARNSDSADLGPWAGDVESWAREVDRQSRNLNRLAREGGKTADAFIALGRLRARGPQYGDARRWRR